PERTVAHWNCDRLSGVGHILTAYETVGDIHGDGAHRRFAEVLGDLEHQALALVFGLQCIEDRRQVPVELNIDDRADDLGDLSDDVGWGGHCSSLLPLKPVGERLVCTAHEAS